MKTSFSDLISSKTPTVIDFFATWCGPCKAVGPILEDLKTDLGEGVRIYKIDVDQNPSLASQYNVRSVPTLMIFKNGKLQWRESGVRSKSELKKVIQSMN
ncbi:MAG: thioredoxin [Lewinellaceae bacterium]|nr:thioredoxin [Lewinellaceae bacterium]